MTPAAFNMQQKKRKNDAAVELDHSTKRVNTCAEFFSSQNTMQEHVYVTPSFMPNSHSIAPSSQALPPRPTTPPLGMTLAHYDAASGGYATTVVKSADQIDSTICSGMTPAYRSPMERWGSCLI